MVVSKLRCPIQCWTVRTSKPVRSIRVASQSLHRLFLPEELLRRQSHGRVKHETTPTAARCEVPILLQRWLGVRQRPIPRRLIRLHCRDTLQGALNSPSKGPGFVQSLGCDNYWEPDELD